MAREVSDGKSVKVTVPANTSYAVAAGDFVLFDGWFGWAFAQAPISAAAQEIALNIEQKEYETSQIDTAQAYAKGATVYFDTANRRLTSVAAGNVRVGRVTVAKAGSVIWFVMADQVVAGGAGAGGAASGAAIVSLTDNSAGTANDVVEALADGTTYATDVAAIRNNFADLSAKVNAILAALRAAGIIAA